MSRATGDGVVGRRSVPPLDCGSVSGGTEPRRERPHLPPRSVTPRAAQEVVHVSVPHVGCWCRCGAARVTDRGSSRGQEVHVMRWLFRPDECAATVPECMRRIACVSGCLSVRWCHVCDGRRWRQGRSVQAILGAGASAPPEPRERHDRGRGDRVRRNQAARTGVATRQALSCESSLTPAF